MKSFGSSHKKLKLHMKKLIHSIIDDDHKNIKIYGDTNKICL